MNPGYSALMHSMNTGYSTIEITLMNIGQNLNGYYPKYPTSTMIDAAIQSDLGEKQDFVKDETALHTAISKRRLEHLRMLLDSAVQIDRILFFAVSVKSPESLGGSAPDIKIQIIELLLERGAWVNQYYSDAIQQTPLIFAVFHEDDEVVKVLLKAGADIKLKDGNGNTALYYAKLYGRFKICDLLKQASPRWYKRR
jgi:ankyrin repeat protein